ncbi:MMS19 nucleotide excision repair protein homolog isoform X2 [Belonocnema kinseyi]|uniref:MMS19 nucleotide excision repair protein homolog isoform X2 n=1 Tax=Belonocnema kinseyi TaxID=2817044 RepID=UPI00143CCCD5|nr:MMS19 nucleotide excision repair protein homolog isoform X2 [Belonocnema kinseyi]
MNSPSCTLKEKLLTALKNNKLTAECENIASELKKGDIKLYNFVEGLQPLLTNEDVALRKQSVEALSALLASIPRDFLSEAELSFIVEFYCDRLKDNYIFLSATLNGILTIVQMKNLPENAPVRLFTTMFQHVQCQTLLLPVRQVMYSIFETMLGCNFFNLKSLGQDIVYGFINSIDGESDPRNLLMLFRMIPNFVKAFSLGHLTEEMFEVIACYFPVHYNTPKTEGCGITREDLAEALAPCLCAIPEFAEFCLPLLVEKIGSNFKVAKLDSLNVLSQGAVTFGVKGLEPHLREIWQALQREIMQNDDCVVRSFALRTTTSLMKVLKEDKVACCNFVDEIIANAKWTMCNARTSVIKNAKELLKAVAMSSEEMCAQVIRAVLPLCLLQYTSKNNLEEKLFLMDTFNSFILIASEYGLSIKKLALTDVPSFYLEELNTKVPEVQTKVLQGLIAQREYLNETQRVTLYEKVLNEIETGCDNALAAFHVCLYSFAESYPIEVLKTINSRFNINDHNVTTGTITRRIEALTMVAKIPKVGCEILPKLIDTATSQNIEVSLAALSCLRKLLTIEITDFDIHRFLDKRDTINRLLATSIPRSDQWTYLVSNISRLIIRKMNAQEQKAALEGYNRVLEGVISDSDVCLINGVLISLHPDVELRSNVLVKNLYEVAVKSQISVTRVAACKLIAAIINKMKDNKKCEHILQFLKENISGCLESNEIKIENKKAHCVLLRWLTKSVVMKGTANSQEFLDYQIKVLKNPQVGEFVANEFSALVDKCDDTLTKDNFCQVKILYKQRIFENIIKESNNASLEYKKNYVTSCIRMAEEAPVELVLLYLKQLVPCFVETLDDDQILSSTLTVLQSSLETGNDVFVLHAQYLISKFSDLSSHKQMLFQQFPHRSAGRSDGHHNAKREEC